MKRIITTVLSVVMVLSCFSAFTTAADEESPKLKADSSLILSKDSTYVTGIKGSITAAELISQFEDGAAVKDSDGNSLEGNALVPTESKVEKGGAALDVIIAGDADKDGEVNIADCIAMLKKVAGWDTEISTVSANVDLTGDIELSDCILVLKYIAGWNVRLGIQKIVVDEEAQKATYEDRNIGIWATHSTDKQFHEEYSVGDDVTYTVYSAKNEEEGCFVYVSNNRSEKCSLSASVTEFTNCYGETVDTSAYQFFYVGSKPHGTDVPDALVPVTAPKYTAAEIKPGQSQGYFVLAKTTPETREGMYEATLSINEGSKEVKRVKLYLNVWNFTLDEADACNSSFGLSKGNIFTQHKVTADQPERAVQLYKNYYDFLLEYRMCPVNLPYDITDERCDEYLNNEKVKNFLIAGYGYGNEYDRTDEQIRDYYAKLSTNEEWFNKGYFYYKDEPWAQPTDTTPAEDIVNAYNKIQNLFPGGKSMIPLDSSKCMYNRLPTTVGDVFGTGEDVGIYELFDKTVQIWVPKSYAFTPEKHRGEIGAEFFLDANQTAELGTYAENIARAQREYGTESWWYFSCTSYDPYANFDALSEGTSPRISFWQQKQCDVDGVLYFLVNGYGVDNPYRNIAYNLYTDVYGNERYYIGDGILIYPGYKFGIDSPISSIRCEAIRDGIEDYMYLKMFERLAGENADLAYIEQVSTDVFDYNSDSTNLANVRVSLGRAIEAYVNGYAG